MQTPGQLQLWPQPQESRTRPLSLATWSTPATSQRGWEPTSNALLGASSPRTTSTGKICDAGAAGTVPAEGKQRSSHSGASNRVRTKPEAGQKWTAGNSAPRHAAAAHPEGQLGSWRQGRAHRQGQSETDIRWGGPDMSRFSSNFQLLQFSRSSPVELQARVRRHGWRGLPLPKRTSPAPGSRGNSLC